MSERPSFETAAAAMAKLVLRFGGEDIEQPRRVAELRLLALADRRAVEEAVTRICRRWVRRPTPDELGTVFRDHLHGRSSSTSTSCASDVHRYSFAHLPHPRYD